ncbi:MAG: NAD(P)/FAD-dependent oxidoreductase [Opitutaceae bacterium]|jgi:NADH dehydrogenase
MNMTPVATRLIGGGICGALCCYPLASTHAVSGVSIPVAVLMGAGFSGGLGGARRPIAELVLAGGALGIPLWALVTCAGVRMLTGQGLSAEAMRMHFPALLGWILFGCALGLVAPWINSAVARVAGSGTQPQPAPANPRKRIVILGGGFAGLAAAEGLEEGISDAASASVTLVSDQNALLFTPMLAEVAGGSLEPGHISAPLRTALKRTEFVRGRAESVDFERRTVRIAPSAQRGGSALEVPYDHLVLAVGSVSNYFGAANIQRHAFDFKTLLDAIRIRNHVIEMFERADREVDPDARRTLVTFVVAGGGFAGVELAGALNDFARGILADYPSVPAHDVRIVLVHSRDRILPELSDSLGRYAQERMAARGVEFRLSTRVLDARKGAVVLSDGEIPTQTLAWTAGSGPSPWLKSLGLETDKRGAVVVEGTMAVAGRAGVWALGDCAALKDARGGPCPPTAQFALREGKALARNICRSIEGKAPVAFHFDSLGALCVVGHQTACAELTIPFSRGKQLRFSGLLAWMMWRGIYVSKLPGLERKVRVLFNWTFEMFFPRDIVQTIDLRSEDPS